MKPAVTFLAVCASLLAVPVGSAQAPTLMSAVCSEPVGVRYDRVGNTTERSDDGFSGVHPRFIFSKSNPGVLTVIWPDSAKLGDSAKQNTLEATIVSVDDSMITAAAAYGVRVDLYSLFPKRGVAFMSTHKTIPTSPEIPSAALFKLECKFETN
jgi:hypothetical protein